MKNRLELWQTVYSWLNTSNNRLNSKYCKEEITTHPDYPSLISLIDFLELGGMFYKAIRADASYIHEFNYPLLAHIRQPGDEYMHIIPNALAWDKQKEITAYWTGIVIYLEQDTQWQNKRNAIYQRDEVKRKMIATAFALAGITLYIIFAFQIFGFSSKVFGLLSLIGIAISLFALGTELGFQSQIVKQVCGAVSGVDSGCEQVLKSQYAKGFAGITPADASVLYFASQFFVYLFGSRYPFFLQSLFIFALCGITIATWSVYIQAFKLKQWCALCMLIVAVLVLQGIIAFGSVDQVWFFFPEVIFISVFIMMAFILLPIKKLIKVNSRNKFELAELKKWKMDGDLFINQWKQEASVNITIWQDDLLLGNPDAPLQITVACNPYCAPCAKAHTQLDNLLHHYSNKVKVQIRLLSNVQDKNDKRTIATQAILQKAATLQNNIELQQMLTDWFESMNFEKWSQKWRLSLSEAQEPELWERLRQHSQWVEESNITSTPTFFINGKRMPGRYSLNDIETLIPQLAEFMQSKIT